MYSVYKAYIFSLIPIICIVNGQYNGGACRINRSLRGNCVSVYDCPPALSVLERRPISRTIVENLRTIQCGFERYIPYVCCSDQLNFEQIPTEPMNTPPTRTTTLPPVSTTARRTEDGNTNDLLPNKESCGRGDLTDKIFNGVTTAIDEYPWMALLGYRKADGSPTFQCGGVLISRRYILTAAHCVEGQVKIDVGELETVRLGEYDLQTERDCTGPKNYELCAPTPQDIRIEKIIPHSGFVDGSANRKDDIALLRLSRNVDFNDFVKPICLPDTTMRDLSIGESLFVAGWGKTLNASRSNVKLKLNVPLFDKVECSRLFATAGATLTQKQICAGGQFAKDTCRGDSGGPLMLQSEPSVWTTIGVVSFGYGCGADGWPGVYTRVYDYMDWIRSNIKP